MKIFPILTSLIIFTSATLPAAPAEIQMRSGDVAFSQDRLRTAGCRSAAEARLPGDGTLRLAVPGDALTADSVVTVTNSSDLTAFAEAVVLANLGENLTAEGSTFSNRPGGISLDAGTIYQRTLTLRNNTLAADVIKARGFNIPEVTPSSSKAAASTPDNSCASTGKAAVPSASGARSR